MRLDKWKLLPCVSFPQKAMPVVVEGKLYGHPNIADGDLIVTSPIEIIDDRWIVDVDGNTYELGSKG